jgi:prepilin-type processing-associated H-X9-DG protein
MGRDRHGAFGVNPADGTGGAATISSCLYLLVKYERVATETFVCPSDAGTTPFTLSNLSVSPPNTFGLADAWDFGPPCDAQKHCSYAYHIPFSPYALKAPRDPGFPVAADRNPWIKSPAADRGNFASFRPDIPPWNGSPQQARAGNAITHESKGQNVLFVDGHVEFAKRAYCGLDDDNIYTVSTASTWGSPVGTPPAVRVGLGPNHRRDAVLVHDPDVIPYGALGTRTKPEAEGASATRQPEPTAVPRVLPRPQAVGRLVVIESFERYGDEVGRRPLETWIDGVGFAVPEPARHGNESNSTVGHDIWAPDSPHYEGSLMEQAIVHGGTQSLPFYFSNDEPPFYSQIEAMWEKPQDLTAYAADVLAVYVCGGEDNGAEPLYFAVEDDTNDVVVNHPDPNILTATEWIEWRMPLRVFSEAGVDLTRVRKLYIGVGDRNSPKAGGSGVLYIDDIQLKRDDGLQGD